ncbi:MAG: substrate-binding domain-containing protein [Caulobacteraceae bacterium]
MTASLTVLSSMATREVLAELAQTYGRDSGLVVEVTSVGGVDAARRVRAGERMDIVMLASGVMETLEAEGHVVAGSRAAIARSAMAVAVPEAGWRPDIASAAAVREAISRAKTVCYSTGPSGDHLLQLLQQWGVADAVQDKMLQAPAGVSVASLIADGRADLGFQQLSELIDHAGVHVLGPLPAEIQAVTIFSAGVAAASAQEEGAGAFIRYLASPATTSVKRRRGMDAA